MATALQDRELDAVFTALSDATRRDIVARLSHGEATLTDLAATYAMTVQAVSQHLKVLERCGLITRERQGQSRPCRLAPDVLDTAAEWIEDSRRTWEQRVDRLEAHLARVQGSRRG